MPVAIAVCAAIVGALLTLAVQSFLAMRNMDISAINDHIALISAVEGLATEYWLSDGEAEPSKEIVKAAKLRGTLDASITFEDTAKRLFGRNYVDFRRLDGELFDCSTGGNFETINRAADPERAIAVMQTCNRLRGKLRVLRRQIFWAH